MNAIADKNLMQANPIQADARTDSHTHERGLLLSLIHI